MRLLSLMCAGLALTLMMNTDTGHDHSLMNLGDGADEPTSGGGSDEVAADTAGEPQSEAETTDDEASDEVDDGDDGDDDGDD